MKISKPWKELVQNAELNNTVGGGISVPFVSIRKFDSEIVVHVKVPTVQVDHLKVALEDDKILIFRMINVRDKHGSIIEQFPLMIHWLSIPEEIDQSKIHVDSFKDEVEIVMPLNEATDGSIKNIELYGDE